MMKNRTSDHCTHDIMRNPILSKRRPPPIQFVSSHQATEDDFAHTANLALKPRAATILKLSNDASKDNLPNPRIRLVEQITHHTRDATAGARHALWRTKHGQNLSVAINQDVAERSKSAEEVRIKGQRGRLEMRVRLVWQ